MAGREMYKAVCAECGQECEVPFKPDPSRPVYCRECYSLEETKTEEEDIKLTS